MYLNAFFIKKHIHTSLIQTQETLFLFLIINNDFPFLSCKFVFPQFTLAMKKRLHIMIWVLFFSTYTQAVFFKHIEVKDGLSQLSVHSIYQDKLGRMWFGTMEGLSIYNGESIINYKNFDHIPEIGIKSSLITHINGNKEGDVFFITDDNLIRYDIQKDQFHFIKKGVHSLINTAGIIYVSASDSLLYWDDHTQNLQFLKKTEIKSRVLHFLIDSNERLWLGTNQGLFLEDEHSTLKCIIPQKHITCIYESSKHDLWIGTINDGMYQINPNGKQKQYLHNEHNTNSISNNYVRTFEEDYWGNIWIGTFNGLNLLNLTNNTFSTYKKDYLKGSLSHSSIFSIFRDKQGILWIGTYYGGVNYFDSNKTAFTYYPVDPQKKDFLNFPFISNMTEDKRGYLWICTEGGGLNRLDRQSQTFKDYTASLKGNSLRHNNLKDICYDADNDKLYIATYLGGLSSFDIKQERFTNYIDFTPYQHHRNINCVKDYKDHILFSDDYGLFKLKKETNEISPLFSDSDREKIKGRSFIIDSNDYLWLINRLKITKVSLNDIHDLTVFHCGEYGLAMADITSVTECKTGDIYLTTEGAGIYKYDPINNSFINFTTDGEKIQSNFCYALIESGNGNLVISSDKGICIFDPKTESLLYSAVIDRDIPITAINNGCGMYIDSNYEIFAGSADGLISFFEKDFMTIDKTYNLYFSEIIVNHTKVIPTDNSGILQRIPAYTDHLKLNHKQNNLIISFANNNYLQSSNSTLYEYKLKGFDTQWYLTHNTYLTYTNLNPGKYTLLIREKTLEHTPSNEIQLSVMIQPPFYNTAWAWIIYILLFLTLLYVFLFFRQRQIHFQASLEYERKEKEYIISMNNAKQSFFVNVSHELRTPISLIIAQIELLLHDRAIPASIKQKIQMLYKHTHPIINLINELLDFQKLNQKQTSLYVSNLDIVPFIQDIFSHFNEKADALHVRYNFHTEPESIMCWFDPKQLRKVIHNLLSNAFKFTPASGLIELFINLDKDNIIIKVSDNGIGIEKKDLKNIFERFYQTSNNILLRKNDFSTGIGLSICKEIIEMHHGQIQVESKVDYGTIFIVTLKTGFKHLENDPMIHISNTEYYIDITDYRPNTISPGNIQDAEELLIPENIDASHTLLLVEDNKELLDILISLFSPFYRVLVAHDGEEGLLVAKENKPDIIISDVKMPKLNGDQMCMELKQHIETCHIPIILLTAQTSVDKNIEGLQKGADDYITKPFNTQILLSKCNSLIRNRLLLQQKYKNEPASTILLLANNEMDKKFLEKIDIIIEKHLDNTDFSIDMLANEFGMGRRTFYSKFKQLTGMTPNDFILDYKLKKAVFLLMNNEHLSVRDISEMLGFSSSHYFSKCFKSYFNESPMIYKKTHQKMQNGKEPT